MEAIAAPFKKALKVWQWPLETKLLCLAMMGPFLLLASLSSLFVRTTPMLPIYGAASALGVLLVMRLRLIGVLLTSVLLGSYLYYFFPVEMQERIWSVGIACSVTLGLLVTSLALLEIKSLLARPFEDVKRRETSVTQYLDRVNKARQDLEVEKVAVEKKLIDMHTKVNEACALVSRYKELIKVTDDESILLRAKLDGLTKERGKQARREAKLSWELAQKQEAPSIAEQRVKVAELMKKLNCESMEHYQLQLLYTMKEKRLEMVEAEYAKYKQQVLEGKGLARDAALTRMDAQYNQLRDQFTEKSDLLDSIRRELFDLQCAYEALKRERDEELYEMATLDEPLDTNNSEFDVRELERLVTKLM